jgi:hypothetical protein
VASRPRPMRAHPGRREPIGTCPARAPAPPVPTQLPGLRTLRHWEPPDRPIPMCLPDLPARPRKGRKAAARRRPPPRSPRGSSALLLYRVARAGPYPRDVCRRRLFPGSVPRRRMPRPIRILPSPPSPGRLPSPRPNHRVAGSGPSARSPRDLLAPGNRHRRPSPLRSLPRPHPGRVRPLRAPVGHRSPQGPRPELRRPASRQCLPRPEGPSLCLLGRVPPRLNSGPWRP